jgi:hypothetical protein
MKKKRQQATQTTQGNHINIGFFLKGETIIAPKRNKNPHQIGKQILPLQVLRNHRGLPSYI